MREGKKIYRQEKSACGAFLTDISKTHELIAPVKDDVVRFESVTSVDKITLESPSFFPVKDFFFLKEEVIFTFEGNDIKVPELKPIKRVFFGLRRCDLNGIKRQDTALLGNIKEPYYQIRRKLSTLIGFHCEKAPLEYCFCESLEKEEFFDLMYYDRGDHYLIEIGSDAGRELIEKYFDYFTESQVEITPEEKIIEGADRLIKKDISALYEHENWKKGVELCLSCAACTSLCPTCFCFEIHDETKMSDPNSGSRKRYWSSCQLQSFSRVAGDFVFRSDREERFKHRIYHQLQYFKERFYVNLCVGCGRCIQGCPTRIDFVKLINEM